MKHILALCSLAILAMTLTACLHKFEEPERRQPTTDADVGDIIAIAELKWRLFNDPNYISIFHHCNEPFAAAAEIPDDVYLRGIVTSDDRQGNFFRQIMIQDEGLSIRRIDTIIDGIKTVISDTTVHEPSGIAIKIGRTSLHSLYDLGQIVYVRLKGLTIGFFRGTYEIGDFPELIWDVACGGYVHRFATSHIDVPRRIETHILPGKMATPITPRVVTMAEITGNHENPSPDFIRNNMLLGTLVTIENLVFDSTDRFLGNLYPRFDDLDGQTERTGIEIAPQYNPNDIITTWALNAVAANEIAGRRAVEEGTSRVVFLRGNSRIPVTVSMGGNNLNVPIAISPTQALTVSHHFSNPNDSISLAIRTSGYSRFAGSPVPRGAPRNITGIIGIHTGRTGGFARYQIAIRDLNDVAIPQD